VCLAEDLWIVNNVCSASRRWLGGRGDERIIKPFGEMVCEIASGTRFMLGVATDKKSEHYIHTWCVDV
jgi:hypothetical protein